MPSTNDQPALISEIFRLHHLHPDAQTCHNATENPFGLACPWARVEVRVYKTQWDAFLTQPTQKALDFFGTKEDTKFLNQNV